MRDHPRLCGEKFMSTVVIVPSGGSPPPMRGKVQRKVRHDTPTRITPAYAGKRFHLWVVHSQQRDHPRLCGEKRYRTYIDSKVKGSPPPMRGKVAGGRLKIISIGITPAYAGKSVRYYPTRATAQDHPRLCGEKNTHRTTAVGITGSPPPMRGKDRQINFVDICFRITPAYAGKSFCAAVMPSMLAGSPPPMRGKERTAAKEATYFRITPAYAGKRSE